MLNDAKIFQEMPGFYRIVPLNIFRRTPGVTFDNIPTGAFPRIDAIDQVIHQSGAMSPGPVGTVERPWYMHTHQDDHLVVLHGTRHVDIYTRVHGSIEHFEVQPHMVRRGGEVVYEGPALLMWPRGVFHRIRSGSEGSAAVNFAVHHEGMDMKTNFSIYELDTGTGDFRQIRKGSLDQTGGISPLP